jgi:hypothetical protein
MKEPERTAAGERPHDEDGSESIVIKLTLMPVAETPEGVEYDIKADSKQLRDGDEEALLHVLETLVANIKGLRNTQEPS